MSIYLSISDGGMLDGNGVPQTSRRSYSNTVKAPEKSSVRIYFWKIIELDPQDEIQQG